MLSVPDVAVVSVLALLLFGPDRLPKVMRQAGRLMRDLQNTSHSFIAEMERAADTTPVPPLPPAAGSRAGEGNRGSLNVEVAAKVGYPLLDHRSYLSVEALALLVGQAPVDQIAGR